MSDNSAQIAPTEANDEELLNLFSEKWNVSGAVADAEISAVHSESVERYEHERIIVDESVQTVELPVSSYESHVDKRRSITNRYAKIPESETSVPFVEVGRDPHVCSTCDGRTAVQCGDCSGDGIVTCSGCRGNGPVKCRTCSGSSTVKCDNCRGHGTTGHGDNESQCPSCGGTGETSCGNCGGAGKHPCRDCGGSGTLSCGNCGGKGQVTCGTCSGEGRTVTTKQGEIQFTYETPTTYETERIPEDQIPQSSGKRINVSTQIENNPPDLGGSSVFEHHITSYRIPSRIIYYTIDDSEYEFYQIGDSISAVDYPKSKTRHLLTGIATISVISLLVGGAWYLGYISL